MNINEYYKSFKEKVSNNIDLSLKDTHGYYTTMTNNRKFLEDYNDWLKVLDGRLEVCIYKNAAKAYQEAIGNMLMGLYQPAFMGLRYFLERTLMGVYLSASEVELRTWLAGNRDTYWSELIGSDDEEKAKKYEVDQNVNKGLYSLKFTKAFFKEFADVCKTHRGVAKMVYRECSEYVHGNPHVLDAIGQTIDFSEALAAKWNDCADTVARCILYAFMMRYWNTLEENQKNVVCDRLKEEFSKSDVIKDFI